MSPLPSSNNGPKKDSNMARVLGSGTSGAFAVLLGCSVLTFGVGIAELLVFHPVDTIAKRLMSNTSQVMLFAKNIRTAVNSL